MIYRDDDINLVTNVDEFAAFHAAFVEARIPHTLGMTCHMMGENHAVNNYIKGSRLFDIQVHGWTHRDYSKCSEDETYRDLMQCVEFIQWKFGQTPRYFYPPWNIEGQEPRRAAARAGLIFDNHRVEARDYLRGAAGSTVNLHYWQDRDIIRDILGIELSKSSVYRKAFHEIMWEFEGRWVSPGGRVLFVGKTHVHDYDRYVPKCQFTTLDIDPGVRPDVVGDIHNPPPLEPFDAVILFGVYELLNDPQAAIRACERLTKPGGTLLIGSPTAPGPRWTGPSYSEDPDRLSEFKLQFSRRIEPDYSIGIFRNG